jgi:hypothetical protein
MPENEQTALLNNQANPLAFAQCFLSIAEPFPNIGNVCDIYCKALEYCP